MSKREKKHKSRMQRRQERVALEKKRKTAELVRKQEAEERQRAALESMDTSNVKIALRTDNPEDWQSKFKDTLASAYQ